MKKILPVLFLSLAVFLTVMFLRSHKHQTDVAYGKWNSPITAEMVSQRPHSFDYIQLNGNEVYWIEERPSQEGRCVLMCFCNGKIKEVTPKRYNIRSKVYEYGGLAYTIDKGTIYFVNYEDQGLYAQTGDQIELIYKGKYGLAEPVVTRQGIVAVAETHHENGNVQNSLILIDPASGDAKNLVSGDDFYAAPTISPDGKKLAWLSWNHPHMPWDETELSVATFANQKLKNVKVVAGGEGESILQPRWSPSGDLHFISDKNGFWNIYRLEHDTAINIFSLQAEFTSSPWELGLSSYGFDDTQVIATFQKEGKSYLIKIDKNLQNELLPFEAAEIESLRISNGVAAFVAGFQNDNRKVISFDLLTNKITPLAGEAMNTSLHAYSSIGESITYTSKNGRVVHAIYYAPKNPLFKAPDNTKPPLIVKAHGGPTLHVSSAYKLPIQFWTSRGFAVLDVNYGGSSGYGRKYRDQLVGSWGKIDYEDCEAGALFLIEKGVVDPDKIAIEGASAGGFTTLCALTFGKVFKAGCSHYGVTDLTTLAQETHNFESHYLDKLVGTSEDQLKKRSPLYHIEKLNSPIIFFQGTEDNVVPLNQAKVLYSALKSRIPDCELILYEGEGHGFRKGEHIKDAFEKELAFYLRAFDEK